MRNLPSSLVSTLLGATMLLGGLALGYLFAAPEVQAGEGWACYAADRFPNVERARSWGVARNTEAGLDQVAPHVPEGEVLVIYHRGAASEVDIVCVKH